MNKGQIRARVNRLIKEHGLAPPIDVTALAASMGLRVREEALESGVSGMLVVKERGGVIVVNREHHPNRKRFSIAHEIGHFDLHRETARVFIDDQGSRTYYRDGAASAGTIPQEIQANEFAAELLMPRHLVQDELNGERIHPSDEETVSRMARSFGVSTQAMSFRLANLGLILG